MSPDVDDGNDNDYNNDAELIYDISGYGKLQGDGLEFGWGLPTIWLNDYAWTLEVKISASV